MLIYYSLFFSNNILKRVFLLFTSFKKYVLVRSLQITCTINVSLILFLWLFFLCVFLFGGGVIFWFCFALVFMTFISHILTGSYDFGSPYQYRNYNPFQYQYYGYPYDNYQHTLNPYDNDYDYRRPLFTRSFNWNQRVL